MDAPAVAAASPALGIVPLQPAAYPPHMKNDPVSVAIELQVDGDGLEETLGIIESLLDSLGHIGLIRTAHISVEEDSLEALDLSGPMLTEMVQ